MSTAVLCKRDKRREKVRAKPDLNGLDYLEVESSGTQLSVFLLGKLPKAWQDPDLADPLRRYFRIEGGRRIRDVAAAEVFLHATPDEAEDDWIEIRLNKRGDFSTYRLSVVSLNEHGQPTRQPHPGFDPGYASLDFSFTADCAADLDCKAAPPCPPPVFAPPAIDYLAKDYASFRQLILDRMALLIPNWQERHVPDLGITLIEILAYAGDQLSYYQDAVATEAYLNTARRRTSVRRHARLVDYTLHEGCNARAWVTLQVSEDIDSDFAFRDFYFITGFDSAVTSSLLDHEDLPRVFPRPYVVFEPLVENPAAPVKLYASHNETHFYTFENQLCCLPKGTTSATLADPGSDSTGGHQLRLKVCDVLIFEEVLGPKTGNPADADPTRRHAVRLTEVTYGADSLTGSLVVDISWAPEDALPFPLCLSSVAGDCRLLENVSVARGNVILVDHGESFGDDLGSVPTESIPPDCEAECCDEADLRPQRFRPPLPRPDLTYGTAAPSCRPAARSCCKAEAPLDFPAAATALLQDPRAALPKITLSSFPALPDGTPAFGYEDLLDPSLLAKSLRHQDRLKSRYLLARCSEETLGLLKTYDGSDPLPANLALALIGDLKNCLETWQPQRDLLGSGVDDRHFVVEMEEDRRASLRFGDGELGRMPGPGAAFRAEYRIGNGVAGNLGAETLTHIVFRANLPHGLEINPRNPLPAQGGIAPEPMTEAKLYAPDAYRRQLRRAVTAEDYATIVLRDFPAKVQRAAATLHWTGHGCEVQVAIDPWDSSSDDPALLGAIEHHLAAYRRIGHDLVIQRARYVPLYVELSVCVQPGYLRGHVRAALLAELSNRVLPGGRLGFFHPDRLSFGGGIYLSALVAAAQSVEGVESVSVDALERLFEGPNGELDNGLISLAPLEIARLDNDPSLPESGRLVLNMGGGR